MKEKERERERDREIERERFNDLSDRKYGGALINSVYPGLR